MVKNPTANAGTPGDVGLIPGSGRSLRGRNGSLIPVFLPGTSYGQRRLTGYSLWGHKELVMTEHALTHMVLSAIH